MIYWEEVQEKALEKISVWIIILPVNTSNILGK